MYTDKTCAKGMCGTFPCANRPALVGLSQQTPNTPQSARHLGSKPGHLQPPPCQTCKRLPVGQKSTTTTTTTSPASRWVRRHPLCASHMTCLPTCCVWSCPLSMSSHMLHHQCCMYIAAARHKCPQNTTTRQQVAAQRSSLNGTVLQNTHSRQSPACAHPQNAFTNTCGMSTAPLQSVNTVCACDLCCTAKYVGAALPAPGNMCVAPPCPSQRKNTHPCGAPKNKLKALGASATNKPPTLSTVTASLLSCA